MKYAVPLICILFVVIFLVYYNYSSSESELEYYFREGRNHDTIYFRVVDEHGKMSYLHDSGNNPKSKELTFNVVKNEYNDGKSQKIGSPVEVKYGQEIRNLKSSMIIHPENVIDKGLYYSITVNNIE
jgi:hypothetical protein